MATIITWKVNQMYVVNDPTNDYVVEVHYELYGEDKKSDTEIYSANFFWNETFTIQDPLPPDFVPFDQLTKDEVILWLLKARGGQYPYDWASEQELLIETIILEQQKPKVTPEPVPNPWN